MSAAADRPRPSAGSAEPASVRAAVAQDAEVLAAVAAATFELACPPSMTRERVAAFVSEVLSPARFAEYLADPSRLLLLAEGDGTALGYAMLVAGEPQDADVRAVIRARPTAELSKIYVLPRAHGTGAARLMMSRALEWASGAGASGVWLGVNQQNERAQRFYAKSGFERVGTKRFLVGDAYEDDYVMERRLPPHP